MSGLADKAKGKIKQAVGDVSDNDKMKREGKIQEVAGKTKDTIDKGKDAVDKVKDKLTKNR